TLTLALSLKGEGCAQAARQPCASVLDCESPLPLVFPRRLSVEDTAGWQPAVSRTGSPQAVADCQSATGSLAPARSARRALPSLCSGNPFRRFPSGSSQQIFNLRYGDNEDLDRSACQSAVSRVSNLPAQG
ncbi:MAG: hypothetical protein RMK20_04885, partial [Verrucomicrobiales bacterium]|nr:hypothetical protein [Verrucomicrobiales bacterium]